MRRVSGMGILCCWPGLLRLWLQGDWSSLALAVAFGGALNLLVIASVPGVQWIPAEMRVGGWFAIGGVWLFCVLKSRRVVPGLAEHLAAGSGNVNEAGVDDRGLFIEAQGEYLRGHWFEAEQLLKRVLQHSRHDVDAHLMLATLYRRTRRYEDARTQLAALGQLDRAEKWHWEIRGEQRELERLTKVETARGDTDAGRDALCT